MINFKELLTVLNPWWITQQINPEKTRIKREKIIGNLLALLDPKEILIISGARRSGKSTLLFQIIQSLLDHVPAKNILFFSADEPLQERPFELIELIYNTFLELNNPKGRTYFFIDEIQMLPEWEKWIKKIYDTSGSRIKLILSGSNNLMLPSQLSILLSGRILTYLNFPLSFPEFLDFHNLTVRDITLQKFEIKHYFAEYMRIGGFPEVVLEKNSDTNQLRLREYYNSILLRDIIEREKIREVGKFRDLTQFILANISKILSLKRIATPLGLSINVVKEYLQYLENAYFCFTVRFFSYKLKESVALQKPCKIYCIDNGLRNAVAFKTFQDESGKLAENLVYLHLKRKNKEIYYWQGTHEVDIIVKNPDMSVDAINVSYTNEIPPRELDGLREFAKNCKQVRNLLLITEDREDRIDNIEMIPLWKWLFTE